MNDSSSESSTIRSTALGAKGGLVATVALTAFRLPISHSLPPTANFWAKYVVGGDPDDYPVQGLVLHLLYGIGGGGAFGLLFSDDGSGDRAELELRDILRGLVFGVVLSVFGTRVVLKRVLGMDLESDEALIFHVSHVIYGLTLGAWVGSNR